MSNLPPSHKGNLTIKAPTTTKRPKVKQLEDLLIDNNNAGAPSPTSVTMMLSPPLLLVVPPPTKRQKQGAAKQLCLLDYISDDALTAHIFEFLGPAGTGRCTQVCHAWRDASYGHPSLWRRFVKDDFGACAASCEIKKDTTGINSGWHSIYSYLVQRHQQEQQGSNFPDARIVFADDGGNFPGYPAIHALLDNKYKVWCTGTGVDRNVDLVVDLQKPCLLTGFVAANGGQGYSAPLKEALVFTSLKPPCLESAYCYNDESVSSPWVHHLFQQSEAKETRNTPSDDAEQENEEEEAHELQGNEDEDEEAAVVPPQPPQPPQEQGPLPLSLQLQKLTAPPKPTKGAPTPVAAFCFPKLEAAYHAKSEQTLDKPVVGRYIHFKLLSSHSPPGLEHISDNIDLMHFHPKGITIADWKNMVKLPEEVPVPEYKRLHTVRQSRVGGAGLIFRPLFPRALLDLGDEEEELDVVLLQDDDNDENGDGDDENGDGDGGDQNDNDNDNNNNNDSL